MSGSAFDKDLRAGEAREDAFVHVLLRSRVEHKRDKRATEWKGDKPPTGNVCIEYCQSDGNGGKKKSGIAVSTAERWAIEYRAEHWLLVPRETVLALARRARDEKRTRETGDNGNVSALVPIEWFFAADEPSVVTSAPPGSEIPFPTAEEARELREQMQRRAA